MTSVNGTERSAYLRADFMQALNRIFQSEHALFLLFSSDHFTWRDQCEFVFINFSCYVHASACNINILVLIDYTARLDCKAFAKLSAMCLGLCSRPMG